MTAPTTRKAVAAHGCIAAIVALGGSLARPAHAQAPTVGRPATVLPPRRLDSAPVAYPAGAHGDAAVVLIVRIDADGAVADVNVRDGSGPFAEAAAAGVRTWRFAPARRNDLPVAARIRVEVDFTEPRAPSPRASIPEPRSPAPSAPPTPVEHAPAPPSQDVMVRGEREEPSTNHFRRAETRRVAGAFGDPFRVVEALPGIAPWLSGLPYYYVRGSPPGNVGYFVDGISIPLLFHVGAGPSTMAPAFVDSVDLFPGAYPARYGRYAGAIIAGETRPPATDAPHGEFSVRFFDADAYASTPFDGGRGSVAVGARYAYTAPLISVFAPGYALGYWDYQVRASHQVGQHGALTVFAFGAFDDLHNAGVRVFGVQYHRVDLRYDHETAAGTVRVAWTFSQDDASTIDSGTGQQASRRGPGSRLRAELDERVGATVRVRAGLDAAARRFDQDIDPAIPTVSAASGPHTDLEAGAYADAVWRPLQAVEIVPGVRWDVARSRERPDGALQPRLSSRVLLAPRLAWLSAFGLAHQTPTETVFVPASPPDPIELSVRDGYQLSEALELRLPDRMRLRVAAYDSHVLTRHLLGTDQSGEERSRGAEVLFHRDLTDRLGGFISYTLARTDWTDVAHGPAGTARWARAPWDRSHVLTAAAGYDIDRGWRVSARFFIESGRPVQPCAGASGDLPFFYRVDAKVEKQWRWPGGQWLTASLEAFNATDQGEPIGNTCTGGQSTVTRQTPIILPTLGLEGGL